MNHTVVSPPNPTEYQPYFEPDIKLVHETDILPALENQIQEFRDVLGAIPAREADCLHEPYTWTIKQVAGHLIDNEKIFGYRAHRFAAGDLAPLPGYEQNDLVANLDYSLTTLPALTDELELVRQSNLCFFRRLPTDSWDRQGIADDKTISVRAIACLNVGHLRHHLNIIRDRIGS